MAARTDTLVFDGECGFCCSCVAWLQRRLVRPVAIVAWQDADLAALGVSEAECRTAVQWVGASGRVRAGAAAVAAVLRLTRLPWSLAGRVIDLPLVRLVAGLVYRAVAHNRACLVQPGDQSVDGRGIAAK